MEKVSFEGRIARELGKHGGCHRIRPNSKAFVCNAAGGELGDYGGRHGIMSRNNNGPNNGRDGMGGLVGDGVLAMRSLGVGAGAHELFGLLEGFWGDVFA
jgi:hypothetical protein